MKFSTEIIQMKPLKKYFYKVHVCVTIIVFLHCEFLLRPYLEMEG